ncbi:thioredoxin [Rhodalgimonas zhirmunskyi]|uniref:Thioredoxin n=1 Tax=Rhodalgimonas zhirmunskyi TaxID=2964767 RepID=A0AAJ1UAD0_9RHOB|nr:thioredoxin [Rhodoalgimonas zhirmunskyi]MDQ2094198.1 thioredoxin [Rhodoalgimonas zhirmunskyi]
MLELNQNAAAAAGPDVIKDVSEADFMAEVVDASQEVPVIVDFWAPWCGPCKQLGPALEAEVAKAGGKVRMVKVNVDENQMIAGQLRVQSIPTVYAFWQGQPVDGFQGALPASELAKFVEKTAALAGDDGLSEAVAAAEEMLAEGAADDAAQTFQAILGEDPANAPAYGGLIRALIAQGHLDEAEATLNGAPAEITDKPEIEAARAQLDLAREAANAGPVDDLKAQVEADPENHQAQFDLAQALHAHGDVEGAVEQLLDLFKRDRDWNDGAAKAQLLKIFEALPPQDPVALNGRRKLASMILV